MTYTPAVSSTTTPQGLVTESTEASRNVKYFADIHRFLASQQQDIQWLRESHKRKSRQRKEAIEDCARSLEHDRQERGSQLARLCDETSKKAAQKIDALKVELKEEEERNRHTAQVLSKTDKKKMQTTIDRIEREMDGLWSGVCMVAEAMDAMARNLQPHAEANDRYRVLEPSLAAVDEQAKLLGVAEVAALKHASSRDDEARAYRTESATSFARTSMVPH
eukprot:TRINITY_DN43929_c0_g1_i1.p1 TRINITY_DN43929_c0_g1~~TRINITY_DN43929_c0_g1_i1.p1  ORF type:complete len:221 (+),score=48.07 TRINITY_DN43929_c0_g1_i1:49-711(+)